MSDERKPRSIRLTESEYQEFTTAAEASNMNYGDFLVAMVRSRKGLDAFGAILREQAIQHRTLDKLRLATDFQFEFVSQLMTVLLMNQPPVDASQFARDWGIAEEKMKSHLEKARRDVLSTKRGIAALMMQEFLEEKNNG